MPSTTEHPLRPGGITAVVPVYNSEQSLPLLIQRLEPVLAQVSQDYEIILVNDASKDRSWEVTRELAAKHAFVRGINLMRNYGQHCALLAGIRAANFEVIVTLDDDLQNPPEEIPRLLAKLDEGHDVVYGSPEIEQHGLWRDLASKVTKYVLQEAMGADVATHISAYRVFRTSLRGAFAQHQSPSVIIDVLLTWGTTRFASVKVRHDPRTLGQSNYTFRKLLKHALNLMTGYSTRPLRAASLLGFFFTLFGIGVLVYVVGRYLWTGGSVAGFPFLASVIAIFSGAQLFALGVMGEYLARMHLRLMSQPPYAIRESTLPAGSVEARPPQTTLHP